MRKLFLTLAAAAAVVSAASLANRADAMPIGDASGIRAAVDDVAVIDQVHCVPGRLHHRWWNGRPHSSGCGAVIVGPRYRYGYVGPRFYHRPVVRFRAWRGRHWR